VTVHLTLAVNSPDAPTERPRRSRRRRRIPSARAAPSCSLNPFADASSKRRAGIRLRNRQVEAGRGSPSPQASRQSRRAPRWSSATMRSKSGSAASAVLIIPRPCGRGYTSGETLSPSSCTWTSN